jgi:SET domain-containing protein
MQQKSLRVGRSKTGLGLYAEESIRKGRWIVEYTGERLPNKEAEERDAKGNRYLFTINSRWTVDGTPRTNIARYANHGCRPNAESDIVRGKVILRAIRNIQPGDEITYDYGEDHFEAYIKPKGCKCRYCVKKRAEKRAAARTRALRRARRMNGARNGAKNGSGRHRIGANGRNGA